jgi:hypothetical protein
LVADGRIRDLSHLLDRLLDDLPQPVSLWFAGTSYELARWANQRAIRLFQIDEEETLSLVVPSLPFPLPVMRLVLDPVQLVFISRNELTSDGYLHGAVYGLLNLIPRHHHQLLVRSLPAVIFELYLRFGRFPAVIKANGNGQAFVSGDAWALDQFSLGRLAPKYARMHEKLRALLKRPLPFSPPDGVDITPGLMRARLFSRSHELLRTKQTVGAPFISLWRAATIFNEVVTFRVQRMQRQWQSRGRC